MFDDEIEEEGIEFIVPELEIDLYEIVKNIFEEM